MPIIMMINMKRRIIIMSMMAIIMMIKTLPNDNRGNTEPWNIGDRQRLYHDEMRKKLTLSEA